MNDATKISADRKSVTSGSSDLAGKEAPRGVARSVRR
jgi:hypothetical protein